MPGYSGTKRPALKAAMTDYVVTGLVKRRAELAGEIERTHEALRKMVLDLERLDGTIVQFAPDFEPESIKAKTFRPPEDWSKRGEMTRVILSVLRCAAEPLTAKSRPTLTPSSTASNTLHMLLNG